MRQSKGIGFLLYRISDHFKYRFGKKPYAVSPPKTLSSGISSLPVCSFIDGRISKMARIFAIMSHALASAKNRPGQALGSVSLKSEAGGCHNISFDLRPNPNTNEPGSSGLNVLRR